jgi:hypothetical protein
MVPVINKGIASFLNNKRAVSTETALSRPSFAIFEQSVESKPPLKLYTRDRAPKVAYAA